MRLKKLEASEMVDVIHALYEDDSTISSEIQYRVQVAVRKNMYRDLYGREYAYGGDIDEQYPTPEGYSDSGFTSKGYIPPTPVDADSDHPYGMSLDPPVG